jgi:hypothetical protein
MNTGTQSYLMDSENNTAARKLLSEALFVCLEIIHRARVSCFHGFMLKSEQKEKDSTISTLK